VRGLHQGRLNSGGWEGFSGSHHFCRGDTYVLKVKNFIAIKIFYTSIHLTPQDNYGASLPSIDCVTIRHFHWIPDLARLASMFHELLSRDREDGRSTGQPQGVGSETYLNGTSQGPTLEDARLPAPLPARRAYRPEGRAYSSERRTSISVVTAGDS
jgi:hypothetical protein